MLAVLQEHAAGPEVRSSRSSSRARTDDADGAARAFAEVCEGPGRGRRCSVQTALVRDARRRLGGHAPPGLRRRGRAAGRSTRGRRSSGSTRPTARRPTRRPARRLRRGDQGVPEVHARPRLQGGATGPRRAGSTRRSPRAGRAGTGRPAAGRTARPGGVGRGPARRPGEGDRADEAARGRGAGLRAGLAATGRVVRRRRPAPRVPGGGRAVRAAGAPDNPLAYVYRGEAKRRSATTAGRWPTSRRRSTSTRRSRRPGMQPRHRATRDRRRAPGRRSTLEPGCRSTPTARWCGCGRSRWRAGRGTWRRPRTGSAGWRPTRPRPAGCSARRRPR